jgi:uncharacterized protein
VIEPVSIWNDIVDPKFWVDAGNFLHERPGGWDPQARLSEMAEDGVKREVLYPTLGLALFGLDDVETHEQACRAYNAWLIDYCAVDPEVLLGVAMIPSYDPDVAIVEIERCHGLGLRGALLWQTPHPDLPFASRHYDRVWKAAAERSMPVGLHILTGFDYSRAQMRAEMPVTPMEILHGAVNGKLSAVTDALFDLIFSGVFDRCGDLQLVLVENEVGWLPFVIDQYDYYFDRFRAKWPVEIDRAPSRYFAEHVSATFFRDPLAGRLLASWGQCNLMWSNDYPHPNSTWPDSLRIVERMLDGLPSDVVARVTRGNAERLYLPGRVAELDV